MRAGITCLLSLAVGAASAATTPEGAQKTEPISAKPPVLLNPKSSPAEKIASAARFIGDYALQLHDLKLQGDRSVVSTTGKSIWTVSYPALEKRVELRALTPDDPDYKRLDKNKDGRIDYLDHSQELLSTFRTHIPIENEELAEAADLLRRIDRRIKAISEKHKELSLWSSPLKMKERTVFGTTLVDPDPLSTGKHLQLKYSENGDEFHRLIYYNRGSTGGCTLKIRIIRSETRGVLAALYAPHFTYARSCVILDKFVAKGTLRQELLKIIQEERFQEPGPSGLEHRAITGVLALNTLAHTGAIPDLRWDKHPRSELGYSILADGEQHVFLCQPLKLKRGYNPAMPLVVKLSSLPKVQKLASPKN